MRMVARVVLVGKRKMHCAGKLSGPASRGSRWVAFGIPRLQQSRDRTLRPTLQALGPGCYTMRMFSSSTAVPEIDTISDQQLEVLYHVILLNDEDHSYDYVIEMLMKIFGFTESKAYSHAVEVDTRGTTILITCELEKAELKRDQIHAFGPDPLLPRSRGSMAAVVEPAAG